MLFWYIYAGSAQVIESFVVNQRMENTLWAAGVVAIGVVVTVAVEYVFRRVHPATDLFEGIEERLKTVETSLRSAADQQPLDAATEKRLALYASVGTSRLRRLILRSGFSPHFKVQMSVAIALTGRLVDLAAALRVALAERAEPVNETDRQRVQRLADEVAQVCGELIQHKRLQKIARPLRDEPSSLPFMPTMEQTIALIPEHLLVPV